MADLDATVADAGVKVPSLTRRFLTGMRSSLTSVALFLVLFLALTAWVGGPLGDGSALTLQAVDVSGVAWSAPTPGKTTVLYVYATWCQACTLTTPTVDAFTRSHPEVEVVAIAADEPSAVRAALAETPRSFRVVADGGGLAKQLGVKALPTTIILDGQGKVHWNRQGVLLPFELGLRLP